MTLLSLKMHKALSFIKVYKLYVCNCLNTYIYTTTVRYLRDNDHHIQTTLF